MTDNEEKKKEEGEELRKHSFHIIALVIGATLLGAIAVGILVQRTSFIVAFDTYGYEHLSGGPHPAWLNAIIAPFNFNFLNYGWATMPSYLYFMALAIVILVAIVNRKMLPWVLLTIALGVGYSILSVKAISLIVFRQRPFLSLPNNLPDMYKAAWTGWNSFPSGHARDTTMFGVIAATYIPWLKWPMVVFCLFIAFSRVYLGAHFPTDVIAGLIVGYLIARVAVLLTREVQLLIEKRHHRRHGDHPVAN